MKLDHRYIFKILKGLTSDRMLHNSTNEPTQKHALNFASNINSLSSLQGITQLTGKYKLMEPLHCKQHRCQEFSDLIRVAPQNFSTVANYVVA